MELYKLREALLILLLAAMLGFVHSDFTKDSAQCQQQLITLSPCLNYVVGASRAPTPQCCAIVYEKINKTKKCLCILVKDRNEPSLGLKLNATRALRLPSICHAASNPLECIALLGLAPNSTEAQIFIQSANSTSAEENAPISPRSGAVPRSWMKLDIVKYFAYWCLVALALL